MRTQAIATLLTNWYDVTCISVDALQQHPIALEFQGDYAHAQTVRTKLIFSLCTTFLVYKSVCFILYANSHHEYSK